MDRKELGDHIRKLCKEYGYATVMDYVQVAVASRLYELQITINHVSGLSPNERGA